MIRNTPVKLVAYFAGLAVVFVGAMGVGQLAGPMPAPDEHVAVDGNPAGHPSPDATTTPGVVVPGLQVAQDGYRLDLLSQTLSTEAPTPFRFRVLTADGSPVTAYQTNRDKDLHLIVVSRDLSGFQHLHPQLAADGTWSVPLAVPAAGHYRVFVGFQPAGRADGLVLGADVPAPGDYRPPPLPGPARTATVDGYTVTLTGDLIPGTTSKIHLSVSRDGEPVTDLQPYLGAYGHLVALRAGDLAYLHVHPDGKPGDGKTPAGPGITFHAQVPSAGTYRLFLEFQHAGTVHTAEFTALAGGAATADPAPAQSDGHGTGHPHD